MYPRIRYTDKTHKIYRFDTWCNDIKDQQKALEETYKRGAIYHDFRQQLIDKFSSKTYDELDNLYGLFANKPVSYKKNWLFNTSDIGIDMLSEERNIYTENQWMYWYLAIPLEQKEMIDFVDEIKPFFVSNKKMMP